MYYFSTILFFMVSCDFSNTHETQTSCNLPTGTYEVQTANYNRDLDQYELMLFGDLGCVKNPFITNNLPLAKIDDKETTKARLDNTQPDKPVLQIKNDFQIKVTQTESSTASTSSSMWSPFLMGAAGAVGASLLARSLMGRAQYVTPPPPNKNGAHLTGVGSTGNTKKEAISGYKRKYPNSQAPGNKAISKRSFFKRKNVSQNSRQVRKKSFFRTSKPKRRFFRGRRR